MSIATARHDSDPLLCLHGANGKPTHDEIARYAYSIWEQEGWPQHRDLEHWLHAESQLQQARREEAFRAWQRAKSQLQQTPERYLLRA
ncbi:hypothetical protein LBMAG56_10450 [Verrucomicrobiota bacterium]|nr:hypothetical protein LBMAG56_10450 [Verrucomicrobiota bacterium]